MDWLRRLVSQKKRRFTDEEFDLDLTYITDRVIGMSFPASGIYSYHRNRIEDVSNFLQKYHENLYLVINASNDPYDFSKFNNNVISMDWPNHYPCPFESFVRMTVDVLFYLQQNQLNVVVVHCLAGKGRTGSLVNAILYSSGLFNNIEEANEFYLTRRKAKVSYGSQIRYMKYYETFYDKGFGVMSFKTKIVERFSISTADKDFWFDRFFTLSFIDFSKNNLVLAEVVIDGNAAKERFSVEKGVNVFNYKEKIDDWSLPQATEILVVLKEYGLAFATKLFRLNFSMLMIGEKSMRFGVEDLDKASMLPKDFEIKFEFYEIDDFETEQHLFQVFKEMDKNLQITRELVRDKTQANILMYGKSRKVEESGNY